MPDTKIGRSPEVRADDRRSCIFENYYSFELRKLGLVFVDVVHTSLRSLQSIDRRTNDHTTGAVQTCLANRMFDV